MASIKTRKKNLKFPCEMFRDWNYHSSWQWMIRLATIMFPSIHRFGTLWFTHKQPILRILIKSIGPYREMSLAATKCVNNIETRSGQLNGRQFKCILLVTKLSVFVYQIYKKKSWERNNVARSPKVKCKLIKFSLCRANILDLYEKRRLLQSGKGSKLEGSKISKDLGLQLRKYSGAF